MLGTVIWLLSNNFNKILWDLSLFILWSFQTRVLSLPVHFSSSFYLCFLICTVSFPMIITLVYATTRKLGSSVTIGMKFCTADLISNLFLQLFEVFSIDMKTSVATPRVTNVICTSSWSFCVIIAKRPSWTRDYYRHHLVSPGLVTCLVMQIRIF